jgi:hypothetical protein
MRGFSYPTAALACAVVLGCGPSLTWTPRAPGPARIPARERGCAFDVLRGGSARTYRDIGVIELETFYVRNLPRDEARFREVVAEQVCRAGADAVVPTINGYGRYVFATLVKYDGASESGGAGAVPLAPQPQAPQPLQTSSSGDVQPRKERAAW